MTQASASIQRRSRQPGPLTSSLVFVGDTSRLVFESVIYLLRGKVSIAETIREMSLIGVDSLPIIMVISVSTGAVLAFYLGGVLVRFGAVAFVGGTVALSFMLELGPILAGVMVAARSGAAISAEIGSMVVTEQVDALRSLAVSPVRYLVAPRIVACVLMMPLCGLVSDAAGLLGSLVMAGNQGVPVSAFLESVRAMSSDADLIKGLIKTLWFGLTIATVACRQGLAAERGAVGVGRATTSSVVLCVVLIFVSDFFLAQLLMGASIAAQ